MRWRRWLLGLGAAAVLSFPATVGIAWLRVALDGDTPSRSIGRVGAGRLEHGHPIPPWGPGHVTYSYLGAALGRQYVHGSVRDTLTAAFAARAAREPGRTFVLAETGDRDGGRFPPHRTHQAGTSADILVPMMDAQGRPASLPSWPWNLFSYGLELDAKGRLGDLRIDFESLAALLLELDAQARARGFHVRKIILAPEYQPSLLQTPSGKRFGRLAGTLMRTPAWVRHDEHFHVDFEP